MAKVFPLEPQKVQKVETKFRRIVTDIPVPGFAADVNHTQDMRAAVHGRSAADRMGSRRNFNVYDRWGNKWLDFSSGVLITNAGHGRKK